MLSRNVMGEPEGWTFIVEPISPNLTELKP